MKLISLIHVFFAASFLWIGCSTNTRLSVTRELRTGISSDDAVAIVAARERDTNTDLSFANASADCIKAAIRRIYPDLRIVSTEKFRQTALADASPEAGPLTKPQLAELLEDAGFRGRILPLALRYLIVPSGLTTQRNTKPIFDVLGTPQGAASIIGAKWERSSEVTATVFDLKTSGSAGQIRVSSLGQPWVVCVGVLFICAPLAAPAFTESAACSELGAGVVRFLSGEDPPDTAYAYDEEGRVRYSYNPGAESSDRYQQALIPLLHPLYHSDDPNCAIIQSCVERYIEEARLRAEETGYKLTGEDEARFEEDLQWAARIDAGEINRKDVLQRRFPAATLTMPDGLDENFATQCKERREKSVTQGLYVEIHKLTNDLLDHEIGKGARGTMEQAVERYVEAFRHRAARYNYRLTCADDETFLRELLVAKAADHGETMQDAAVHRLETITTRHLLNLYFGR